MIIIIISSHMNISPYHSIRSMKPMKVSTRKSSLQIDDYLDLLNLATNLGDLKWRKEILRKLECLHNELQLPEQLCELSE